MKTIEIFTFAELSPEAKSNVVKREKAFREANPSYWYSEECWTAFRYFCDSLGVSFKNHRLDIPENIAEMYGKRAFALMESRVLGPHRIPFSLATLKRYKNYTKAFYRAGKVKPCPFTGFCMDENLIETTLFAIKRGRTIEEALEECESYIFREIDTQLEHECSEETISEELENDEDTHYTQAGGRI